MMTQLLTSLDEQKTLLKDHQSMVQSYYADTKTQFQEFQLQSTELCEKMNLDVSTTILKQVDQTRLKKTQLAKTIKNVDIEKTF